MAARAIRLTRRIMAQPPLARYRPEEFRPGPGPEDDAALAERLKRRLALVVEADLPVRLSRTLQIGAPLDVALQGSGTLQAPVSRIHPVADPRQNTVRVELTLPSGTGATPGQYVEIRVPDSGAGLPAQLMIPKTAIITKGGLPLVYAIDSDGKARLRVVRLGNAPDGQMQVILSGVSEGDLLVDRPPPGLRSGTQITTPAEPETAQNSQ